MDDNAIFKGPRMQETWISTNAEPDLAVLKKKIEAMGRVVVSMDYHKPNAGRTRGTVELKWYAVVPGEETMQ